MAKKHNIVFKRQNEEEMQSLVLTQHFTYKSAKIWSGVMFFVMVLVPTIINLILYFNVDEAITGYIAFMSIGIIFIGQIISNKIQSEKNKGAMIQQKFDLYVFNMGNISIIDENIVALQLEKYKSKEWDRKKDWYPNYEYMDSTKATFYCQKENLEWTENLSKSYKVFLKVIIVIMLISFVMNMIANNSSLIKVLSILAISLPIISYGLTYFTMVKNVDKEFNEVRRIVESTNENLGSISHDKLVKMIYAIQILIYRYRQKKYLIPDWYEKKLFPKFQKVENRKAGQRKRRDKKSKENYSE